jgi:microcystin synthetase protein McyD
MEKRKAIPKVAFLCNDEEEISPEIIENLLNNEPVFHEAFQAVRASV